MKNEQNRNRNIAIAVWGGVQGGTVIKSTLEAKTSKSKNPHIREWWEKLVVYSLYRKICVYIVHIYMAVGD